MRIAVVHTRQGEVVIFQVKGQKKDLSAIDGFEHYFDDDDDGIAWNLDDILEMHLAHIGSGDAVVIYPKTIIEVNRGCNIDDWIPDTDDQ